VETLSRFTSSRTWRASLDLNELEVEIRRRSERFSLSSEPGDDNGSEGFKPTLDSILSSGLLDLSGVEAASTTGEARQQDGEVEAEAESTRRESFTPGALAGGALGGPPPSQPGEVEERQYHRPTTLPGIQEGKRMKDVDSRRFSESTSRGSGSERSTSGWSTNQRGTASSTWSYREESTSDESSESPAVLRTERASYKARGAAPAADYSTLMC